MTDAAVKALRRFLIWQLLRCSGLVIAWVAVAGILIPNLVDARDTAQLFAAIILAVGMLVLSIVVLIDFVLDFRKFLKNYHILEKE